MEFNNLEKAILKWTVDKYDDQTLTQQISQLQPVMREYTGCGFFIELTIEGAVTDLNKGKFKGHHINGPAIRSPGIEYDGGSIFFHENGKLTLLEISANGRSFKEAITEFELAEYFKI